MTKRFAATTASPPRGRVVVTPLDESTAIDLGTTVGSLVVR
jgi:hypothetical protein